MNTSLLTMLCILLAAALVVFIVLLICSSRRHRDEISRLYDRISTLKKQGDEAAQSAQKAVQSAEKEAKSLEERIRSECRAQVEQAKRESETAMAACRAECSEEIRKAKEYIEKRPEALAQMDEKTLLVNLTMALEGCGARLDRVEASLGQEVISEKISALVADTGDRLSRFSANFSRRLDKMDLTGKLDELSDAVSNRLESYDVTGRIEAIYAMTETLQETISDSASRTEDAAVDICSKLSDVQFDIEEIQETVCEKCSIGTLAYNVDAARLAAEEARDEASDAKFAAERAQSAAEDARGILRFR